MKTDTVMNPPSRSNRGSPSALGIALFLGGPSAERSVSLKSGAAVGNALRELGHSVFEVDPVEGRWTLPPAAELAFLVLHGTFGEDGTLQSELEKKKFPYTGCGPEASRIAFDKWLTKKRLIEVGLPVAKHAVVSRSEMEFPKNWAPPMVIKPVRQGSSVGLGFIDRREQWEEAVRNALEFDSEALVEERIVGREVTAAILDGKALPVVEVCPKSGGYDFANKYTAGKTDYFCPADFPDSVTRRIQEIALGSFQAIGGRDYARVDMIVRLSGEPVVLEINTLPGMTETSLLPKAAAAAGIPFQQLCQKMIEMAWSRKSEI